MEASCGFCLGTGISKTPCVAHRIDQPSPNFSRLAERPSLPGSFSSCLVTLNFQLPLQLRLKAGGAGDHAA